MPQWIRTDESEYKVRSNIYKYRTSTICAINSIQSFEQLKNYETNTLNHGEWLQMYKHIYNLMFLCLTLYLRRPYVWNTYTKGYRTPRLSANLGADDAHVVETQLQCLRQRQLPRLHLWVCKHVPSSLIQPKVSKHHYFLSIVGSQQKQCDVQPIGNKFTVSPLTAGSKLRSFQILQPFYTTAKQLKIWNEYKDWLYKNSNKYTHWSKRQATDWLIRI